MGNYTQEGRALGIVTVKDDNYLLLDSLSGKEALGTPFLVSAVVSAEENLVDFDGLVGTPVTLRLNIVAPDAVGPRFFHGYISSITHTGFSGHGLSTYQLEVVPWLWFLTQQSDCRIFQNKSVPEILELVFKEFDKANFKMDLKGKYGLRDYCVQYRETDFNFVHRLMEHEGIYYRWEFKDNEHCMVLCDQMSAHKSVKGYEKVVYRGNDPGVQDSEYISSWKARQQVTPGSYYINSFNFKAPIPSPNTNLLALDDKPHPFDLGNANLYDFPADYVDLKEGERLAEIRREQAQAETKTIISTLAARGLTCGDTFTPTELPVEGHSEKEYLITAASYVANAGNYGSGTGSGGEAYTCTLSAIPVEGSVFRSPIRARIPRMAGPQTAIVTGPEGEEIYTDKYGRVTVQFHWDLLGKYDDKSSCWVRVSQAWAGKGWGSISIPRVGQEVIVDFLEGNPDMPIITGRVYNGESQVPYDLPAEKTKSTIKTRSTPGGGGFNEIRMEDKKGKEEIFIHAEREMDLRVKNRRRTFIGNTDHLIVKKNSFRKYESDEHRITEGDRFEETQGSEHQEIKGDDFTSIMGEQSLAVIGDLSEEVGGDHGLSVKGSQNLDFGSNHSVSVGRNSATKIGMNFSVDTGMNGFVKAGMNLVLEAGMGLTIKAGSSYITLGPSGVMISGPLVMINSGGMAISGSPGKVESPKAISMPDPPEKALVAGRAEAGSKTQYRTGKRTVFDLAAKAGRPFCQQCKENRPARTNN